MRFERNLRKLYASASLFELCLGILSGVLLGSLENNLRCLLDESLSLAQAQAGELAHNLDDLDLLVASRLENDVELVLLFDLFSSAGSRCSSDGDGVKLKSSSASRTSRSRRR